VKAHKAHWRKRISRDLDGFREVLTWDPFEDWKSLWIVEGPVTNALISAMELYCGDRAGKESRAFLRQAVAIGERVFADNKCRLPRSRGFFPGNRGRTLRAMAYAHWLLGRRLDPKVLIRAADDIKAWCDTITRPSEWDEFNQKDYVGAVAMKLLADDVPGALTLLAASRRFSVAKPRATVLQEVATAASEGKPVTKTVAKRFEQAFNNVRRPHNVELIESFELAAVMQKYIRRPGQKVSPAECLELVSA
jgi:hypothetical protein